MGMSWAVRTSWRGGGSVRLSLLAVVWSEASALVWAWVRVATSSRRSTVRFIATGFRKSSTGNDKKKKVELEAYIKRKKSFQKIVLSLFSMWQN